MIIRVLKLNLYESENLRFLLFAKEGYKTSFWQREVRRDFINNVVIMRLLITFLFVISQKHMEITSATEVINS
jgi:hypothetical protein